MAPRVVEVEAPAVAYRAPPNHLEAVVSALAGIGPGAETGGLVGEEGVAAVDGDAGAVGLTQTIHIVERIQIAAGVGAVDAVIVVGGGATVELGVSGAREDVLEERDLRNQV